MPKKQGRDKLKYINAEFEVKKMTGEELDAKLARINAKYEKKESDSVEQVDTMSVIDDKWKELVVPIKPVVEVEVAEPKKSIIETIQNELLPEASQIELTGRIVGMIDMQIALTGSYELKLSNDLYTFSIASHKGRSHAFIEVKVVDKQTVIFRRALTDNQIDRLQKTSDGFHMGQIQKNLIKASDTLISAITSRGNNYIE